MNEQNDSLHYMLCECPAAVKPSVKTIIIIVLLTVAFQKDVTQSTI